MVYPLLSVQQVFDLIHPCNIDVNPLYDLLTLKLLHVQDESYFTLRDIKGSKLSGSVFNILFNLNKFMAFETRDPFLIRQVKLMHFLESIL